jgi:hypothetical protein
MRALSSSFYTVVLGGMLAGGLACPTVSAQNSNPAVSTVGQAIDQIVAREHDEVAVIHRYTPIVETYVQDMKPDSEMGIVPVKDHYFLGQAEFAKNIEDTSMLDKKKSKGEEFNPFAHLEGSKFVPEGFIQMAFVDPDGFDRSHYEFNYVGREFLGEVRCVVFDITPLPKSGKNRFNGRIWAEDQGFTIVRFNGVFESSDGESKGFNLHFDSWRMNLQPDLWLPALIYSQESELKNGNESPVRFRAQTRLWGYSLTNLNHPADFNQASLDQTPLDRDKGAKDYSPIEAEQKWQATAENNVLDRLQRIGLVAPPGEVDKVLETVINNLEVTNNLDIDVHCRVLLTGTLESFSIGHTIVVSRGLIDVLPDEASLATVLAQELAEVMMTKPSTDQWGFNDTTNVTAADALSHFSFKGTPAEITMSTNKAFDLLKHSPYKDKLGNSALFLKQLSADEQALPSLIDARLGNGVALSSALMSLGPALDPNKLDQVAALPLGGRVKLNPWNDEVELLKAKPVSLSSAREKMPFEVTPFMLYLTRYQAPKPGAKPDTSSSASK